MDNFNFNWIIIYWLKATHIYNMGYSQDSIFQTEMDNDKWAKRSLYVQYKI